ncbi:hypothetical protein BU17DRAFT_56655 [Hysterangium stoloniferum]|nr:hypothetical protein BU17DRAFT_56655 [Hysterangium stoloniferum]
MAPPPTPDEDSSPIALEVACSASTTDWQLHLEQLFHNSRDRFPDVVWELQSEGELLPSEEVWGHKAMVYARAPPTFQARYFSFRPAPVASPSPYGPSPMPAQSAVSLGLSMSIEAPSPARSPSPYQSILRSQSPAPSAAPGQLLRLTSSIASALFSQELEYLYTGKSFGDAFEFLFDSPEKRGDGDGDKNRVDKLRKDLVFMWRSRLYSDVRIQLTGNFSSSSTVQGDPTAAPVFSSHRFILVSRSPYFRTQLFGPFAPPTPAPGQPLTLTLPSPPFTPASLHFTLGFIYTGTLAFSHRTFDLETAFHIMRAATYLSIVSLYDEAEARIIEEMCDGLFMAYTPFAEYEKITGGKWGAVGCKCRQCARRSPRVLEFALSEDVQNERLSNGARRALVGLFGDGWCTPEFAALSAKTRDSLLRGVFKRTIPQNVFPLLYASYRALARLDSDRDKEKDRDLSVVRDMVLAVRGRVDAVLCAEAEMCFEQSEWLSVMDADGSRFEDGEKVEWIMDAVRRGLTVQNAAKMYQTLVSSILLRPHPHDPNETLLSHTSGIRLQVETTRMDVVKWMRTRWLAVQQEGGFEELDGWALKELSHGDVLNRNHARGGVGSSSPSLAVPGQRDSVASSASSVRSAVSLRSTASVRTTATGTGNTTRPTGASRTSTATPGGTTAQASRPVSQASTVSRTPRTIVKTPTPRTPSMASQASSRAPSVASLSPSPISRSPSQASQTAMPRSPSAPKPPPRTSTSRPSTKSPSQASTTPSRTPSVAPRVKPSPSTASIRKSVASSVTASTKRPKSLAPSVATIRKASPSSGASRPGSTLSIRGGVRSGAGKNDARPVSSASMTSKSEASSAFKTAVSESELRRTSIASNATAGRKRTASNASSIASSSANDSSAKKLLPVQKRPPSTASNISTVSLSNRKAAGKAAAAKAIERRESIIVPPVPSIPPAAAATPTTIADDKEKGGVKGKGKARVKTIVDGVNSTPTSSTASEASTIKANTIRDLLKKASNDTITESEPGPPSPQPPLISGATLNVGIPCIISSKRTRFRAFARYIGELEGERGSWVGVEVPVGEAWSADKLEGRPWNDGSWGGRRYFDIGSGMEWDEPEERRKRRKEGSGGLSRDRTLKREGDQLGVERAKRLRSVSPAASDASTTESRGLFVRPQDVIYVVDAESGF